MYIEGLSYVDGMAGMGSKKTALNTLATLQRMEVEKRSTFSVDKTILRIRKPRQSEVMRFKLKEGFIEECFG